MSTGRDVPEQNTSDIKFLGAQSGVNKKDFVDFSPADFYKSWQYFIIRPLTRLDCHLSERVMAGSVAAAESP
jgi:hypothetical protein